MPLLLQLIPLLISTAAAATTTTTTTTSSSSSSSSSSSRSRSSTTTSMTTIINMYLYSRHYPPSYTGPFPLRRITGSGSLLINK